MAQGTSKLNKAKSAPASGSHASKLMKKGDKPIAMKMSNKTSAIVRNKALQKKLWGAATQQTELQLAQRAKGDGKLKIIKPLLGASKDKKDKKK